MSHQAVRPYFTQISQVNYTEEEILSNNPGQMHLLPIHKDKIQQPIISTDNIQLNSQRDPKFLTLPIQKDVNIFDKPFGVIIKTFKFLKNLKQGSLLKNQYSLNQSHQQFLNDLSYIKQEVFERKTLFQKRTQHFVQKLNQIKLFIIIICKSITIPLINPTSAQKIVWDIIHSLVIIFSIYYIPMEWISKERFSELYSEVWSSFIYFSFIFFVFDIFVQLNSGFFEKGNINYKRIEIAKHYFIRHFIFDILSLLPIIDSFSHYNNKGQILNILIFLKLSTVHSLLNSFEETIPEKKYNIKFIVKSFRLILMILCVAHIFSCMLYGLAQLEIDYSFTNQTWFSLIPQDNPDWFEKYVWAFYWATTTMITVGYGDIRATNQYEAIFMVIAMFIACCIFAYSFNLIGELVRENNQRQKQFNDQIILINKIMEKKQITRELRIQVRKFLEFQSENQDQITQEEEQEILNKLSIGLKEKIIIESNMKIIDKCKNIFGRFSKPCQQKLCLCFEKIQVKKDQLIFTEGQFEEDPALFFIEQGTINIFTENVKGDQELVILKTINENSYFGEISFISGNERSAGAMAADFCVIYQLKKSIFLKTLKEFKQDYQKYCLLKDKLNLNQTMIPILIECYCCKKIGHIAIQCPELHFIPDKEKIILKYLFEERDVSSTQMRQRLYKRKRLTSYQVLKNINKIINQAEKWNTNFQKKKQYVEQEFNDRITQTKFYNQSLVSNQDQTPNSGNQIIQQPNQDAIPNVLTDDIQFCKKLNDNRQLKENTQHQQSTQILQKYLKDSNPQMEQIQLYEEEKQQSTPPTLGKQNSFILRRQTLIQQQQQLQQQQQQLQQSQIQIVASDQQQNLQQLIFNQFYSDQAQLTNKNKGQQLPFPSNNNKFSFTQLNKKQEKEFLIKNQINDSTSQEQNLILFEKQFEKLYCFEIYYPYCNYNQILQEKQIFKLKPTPPEFGIYTFFYRNKLIKKKVTKYRTEFKTLKSRKSIFKQYGYLDSLTNDK